MLRIKMKNTYNEGRTQESVKLLQETKKPLRQFSPKMEELYFTDVIIKDLSYCKKLWKAIKP